MKKYTDEQLVDYYIHTKQSQYFNAIYQRYYHKVLQRCMHYTAGDLDEAEDWTQNILIRILEKMKGFRGDARFSTWLTAITINYCNDLVQIRKRQIVSNHDLYIYADTICCDEPDANESALLALRRAVSRLDESERALLTEKYQEGHSIKLLADQYAVTESALKMRLKRAKDRLKSSFHQSA